MTVYARTAYDSQSGRQMIPRLSCKWSLNRLIALFLAAQKYVKNAEVTPTNKYYLVYLHESPFFVFLTDTVVGYTEKF